jgi:hypothetical protein
MNIKRDPDAILAAWLDEGPHRLPEPTRRAIAVSTRNIRQSRLPDWLPWRAPNMNGMTRTALAAVAVVAVVVGGLFVLRSGTDESGGVGGPASAVPSVSPAPSASPLPSASPAPSTSAIPEPPVGAMTQAFTSPTFGYSIQYPAGWTVTPTTGQGPTPGGADDFVSAAGGWYLRALSVAVPDGVVVDDWIIQTLQHSDDPGCMPRRDTMESVTVDGHEGRLLGFCGVPPAPQIEATVVVDKRAYLFTLFDGREAASAEAARPLFDAFMATVKLDPQSAGGSPNPSPS